MYLKIILSGYIIAICKVNDDIMESAYLIIKYINI